MSNEEYTHQNYWTEPNICLQKDENNKCLMSAKFIFLDLSKEPKYELFCKLVKDKKNDKTV